MIRAFTFAFAFEGKDYLALAAINATEEREMQYRVQLYNDALSRLLSQSVLHYKECELEKIAPANHPRAKRLVHCIHDSVKEHLLLARL